MKCGTSTLNPYAESYVPISKRGGPNGKNDTGHVGTESKGAIEGSVIAPRQWDPTSQSPQLYNSHGYGSWHAAEDSKLKGHSGSGFHGSSSYSSSETTEKGAQGEDFEMDVTYLQMTFPGIAEEFLSEIYYANQGDLDSAIDMLNHFEDIFTNESEPWLYMQTGGYIDSQGVSFYCNKSVFVALLWI
ncbi:OLC1v1030138C1 [Oldenlandia corymbosa var. corymbosa]|uniref:OLC1v1030138C1 n=1 Tax=Oldenlandia corymbosa var. corymbosa TaxID=529605 RepID=A0AAV1CG44_OLDCO|nr:OLC1v1030138C1 [Oldenlandia corymbosa var. corymbosa]